MHYSGNYERTGIVLIFLSDGSLFCGIEHPPEEGSQSGSPQHGISVRLVAVRVAGGSGRTRGFWIRWWSYEVREVLLWMMVRRAWTMIRWNWNWRGSTLTILNVGHASPT